MQAQPKKHVRKPLARGASIRFCAVQAGRKSGGMAASINETMSVEVAVRSLLLTMAAAMLGATVAVAQVSDDIISAYTGDWLVLPVDGRRGCAVKLTAEETIGGRVAVPAKDCARYIPAFADASAWYPTEGIQFTDAIRRPVMAFSEDETALLSSPTVADPEFYLVPAEPGLTHLPRVADMPGQWTVKSSNGPSTCSLTLSPMVDEIAVLSVPAPCRKTGLPAGLKAWRLEALDLYLEGDNDAMLALRPVADDRFASDDGTFTLRRGAAD